MSDTTSVPVPAGLEERLQEIESDLAETATAQEALDKRFAALDEKVTNLFATLKSDLAKQVENLAPADHTHKDLADRIAAVETKISKPPSGRII